MRKTFTEDQLLAAYRNAPTSVQDALSYGPVLDFIDELRSHFALSETVVKDIITLIRDTLLELITTEEFGTEVRALVTKKEDADAIIADFNEKILVPIKEKPVVHVSTVAPERAPTPPPAEIARAQWENLTPKASEPPVNRLTPIAKPATPTPPPAPVRPTPPPTPAPMSAAPKPIVSAPLATTPKPAVPVPQAAAPKPAVPTAPKAPLAATPTAPTRETAKDVPSSLAKSPVPAPAPEAKPDPYREPVE